MTDVIQWEPRVGSTGDDRYRWPDDEPIKAGPDFNPGDEPTWEAVQNSSGLNQILLEINRRLPKYWIEAFEIQPGISLGTISCFQHVDTHPAAYSWRPTTVRRYWYQGLEDWDYAAQWVSTGTTQQGQFFPVGVSQKDGTFITKDRVSPIQPWLFNEIKRAIFYIESIEFRDHYEFTIPVWDKWEGSVPDWDTIFGTTEHLWKHVDDYYVWARGHRTHDPTYQWWPQYGTPPISVDRPIMKEDIFEIRKALASDWIRFDSDYVQSLAYLGGFPSGTWRDIGSGDASYYRCTCSLTCNIITNPPLNGCWFDYQGEIWDPLFDCATDGGVLCCTEPVSAASSFYSPLFTKEINTKNAHSTGCFFATETYHTNIIYADGISYRIPGSSCPPLSSNGFWYWWPDILYSREVFAPPTVSTPWEPSGGSKINFVQIDTSLSHWPRATLTPTTYENCDDTNWHNTWGSGDLAGQWTPPPLASFDANGAYDYGSYELAERVDLNNIQDPSGASQIAMRIELDSLTSQTMHPIPSMPTLCGSGQYHSYDVNFQGHQRVLYGPVAILRRETSPLTTSYYDRYQYYGGTWIGVTLA